MGQLQDKVALITGAASGIGAACAATLAREGAKIVVADIDDAKGPGVVETIRGRGGEAIFLHLDVTDEPGWAAAVAETERHFGGLNILVSNAGISIRADSIADMPLADWRRMMAINVDGVFLSVKHSLPAIRRSGSGAIVMISSLTGLRGTPIFAGYAASKGAVRQFSKSIALECAQAGDNIRVNSVHPGIVDSEAYRNRGGPAADEVARAGGTPLWRAATVQEIANGVLFLVSDASSYITGIELAIDGGVTANGLSRPPPRGKSQSG